MKLSRRHRNRLLIVILLPVVFVLACGGVIHYLLVYRLKEGIQYLVKKESKGKYEFDAGAADFSLWGASVRLKNPVLHCMDTSHSDAWYHLRVKELSFSLSSYKELILHRKIILDSCSIVDPEIEIHVLAAEKSPEHNVFRATDMLNYLEKTLLHFNVHSFSLKNASFNYIASGISPLHIGQINLSVSNFEKVNNDDSHLFGSDRVSFSLGRQHWILPGGRQEINFRRLSFESRDQRFQIDSFAFIVNDSADRKIRVTAERFFFNSNHLPAVYQKDQLLLDTLICVHPVVCIPAVKAGEREQGNVLKYRLDNLFRLVNVKFLAVTDGQLLLQDKDGRQESTVARNARLSVYNLVIDSAANPVVSSDSISVNLRKIEFLTADSLYKLSIGEFAFHRSDALFSEVQFGPARPDPSGKEVLFTAPSLILKSISLQDLLRKRLKASAAELRQPLIVMHDKHLGSAPSATKLNLFYKGLHHMSELIDTKDFYVMEGAVHYDRATQRGLQADLKGVNAHILLNKFFISDSLVDIKHAVPDFRIGLVGLTSGKTHIQVGQYRFDGVGRHNWGNDILVTTDALTLMGRDIYWDVFDWDIYERTHVIQVDSLSIGKVDIRVRPVVTAEHYDRPGFRGDTAETIRPILPTIRVGRLQLGTVLFNGDFNHAHIQTTMKNLHGVDIGTEGRYFGWKGLQMELHDLGLKADHASVKAVSAGFNSNTGIGVLGCSVQSDIRGASIVASIPAILVRGQCHSTDPDKWTVNSLAVEDAEFSCKMPVSADTLSVGGNFSMRATDIGLKGPDKDELYFASAALSASKIFLHKDALQMAIPSMSLELAGGQLAKKGQGSYAVRSSLHLGWQDGSFSFRKDSMAVALQGLKGLLDEASFSYQSGSRPDWAALLRKLSFSGAVWQFRNQSMHADGQSFAWEPKTKALTISNFKVAPNKSREDVFRTARWQCDYVTASGGELSLIGMQLNTVYFKGRNAGGVSGADSLIHIRRIMAKDVAVEASRDKHMPFRHGVEKQMPTKLINNIRIPFAVDSFELRQASVAYNEMSVVTGKWSRIPVENINGYLTHLTNRAGSKDSLGVDASGRLLGSHIRRFTYREAYGDSLSGFVAGSTFSNIDLTRFSQVSVPAAAVRITGGHADTAWSNWFGNKYAALGSMNFHYDKLRIEILNKGNTNKSGVLPTLETWAANLILPNKKKTASTIFLERDREKFVFNYWVKAEASGLLSTVGIKRNAAYERQYGKLAKQYSLPERPGK